MMGGKSNNSLVKVFEVFDHVKRTSDHVLEEVILLDWLDMRCVALIFLDKKTFNARVDYQKCLKT